MTIFNSVEERRLAAQKRTAELIDELRDLRLELDSVKDRLLKIRDAFSNNAHNIGDQLSGGYTTTDPRFEFQEYPSYSAFIELHARYSQINSRIKEIKDCLPELKD